MLSELSSRNEKQEKLSWHYYHVQIQRISLFFFLNNTNLGNMIKNFIPILLDFRQILAAIWSVE